MAGASRHTARPGAALRERWIGSVLALACLGSLFVFVHPWYDPTNDGSMYVATARSIIAGEGYSFLGEAFRIRPPGFSVLIAPLIAWFGTDFFVLNLVVSLFGVLTVVALYFFCTPRLGSGLALLVALFVWLNPGFQKLCNQIMSDVPGLALAVLCLLGERRLRSRPLDGRTRRMEFGLGVAIALATYLRSASLLLLPAIVGARLLRRFGRYADGTSWRSFLTSVGLLTLGTVAPLVPWGVRNSVVALEPPADQTRLYSYGTGMWHRDLGDPSSERISLGEVANRFPLRASQVAATLGNRLISSRPNTGALLWTLVFVGATLAVFVRRREPAELFVIINLVVIGFYFAYTLRLALPCFVLALPAVVEVVQALARSAVGSRWADWCAGVVVALAIIWDLEPRRGWEDVRKLHEGYVFVSAELAKRLEPDERLAAYRGWHLAVYLDRHIYSTELAQRRSGRPESSEEIFDKYDIDRFILVPLGLPATLLPEYTRLETYLENRYGPVSGPIKLVDVR